MKQIYGQDAIHILPIENGLVFAAKQNAYDNKIVVSYKMFSFNTVSISPVTRNVYLLAKFGENFHGFESQIKDYLNCTVCDFPDDQKLLVYPNGNAVIYDHQIKSVWKGNITKKGYGPADAVVVGQDLWCSFPERASIVRYNLKTMKEELRIGGLKTPSFSAPYGMWPIDNILLVCDSEANTIREVDISSFSVEDFAEFEEPIKQYMKIGSNEVVLLESGIYTL